MHTLFLLSACIAAGAGLSCLYLLFIVTFVDSVYILDDFSFRANFSVHVLCLRNLCIIVCVLFYGFWKVRKGAQRELGKRGVRREIPFVL